MKYIAAYHTDVGIAKKTNQDSMALKIVETKKGTVAFGIICDGMGGLSKGELASKEVITAYCDWFDTTLIDDIEAGTFSWQRLMGQWNEIAQAQNERLGEYGSLNGIQLGTTLSAILMYENEYYIIHVGDSRIYLMNDRTTQLTHDQTFVAREVAAGRMTPAQAKVDSRRSVLLQCIGASPVVEPEFLTGTVHKNEVYLLCSDGFRHQITDEEMINKIGPSSEADEEKMKFGCMYLTELVKSRRESDNITVVLIRTM